MVTSNHLRMQNESGGAIIAVFWGVIVLMGLVAGLLIESIGDSRITTSGVTETRLLYAADSGLTYAHNQLEQDPLYAVTDATTYRLDVTTSEYVGPWLPLTADSGSEGRQDIQVRVQYLQGKTPVVFADRTVPEESYSHIKVTSTARSARLERAVAGWYETTIIRPFRGAVVSDMDPQTNGIGGSKGVAKLGHVAFDGKGDFYLFGDVLANGNVNYGGAGNLDDAKAKLAFTAFDGHITTGLAGTDEQVPDFTRLGGSEQLFDFDRYEALARAGGGRVYATLGAFAADVKSAAGTPLEGIIIVKIDPVSLGGKPKLDVKDLPQGINVRGTLVFDFADGTSQDYKIVITAAVNVNGGDLTALDPAQPATYPTGYPPRLSTVKPAHTIDLAPRFTNFLETDDLPAVMFNNGVVDFHGPLNVCGVVYGPSFIEIENKKGNIQYVNGAVIGGGGIFFEGNRSGYTAIKFDSAVLDKLATMGGKGQELARVGYAVLK